MASTPTGKHFCSSAWPALSLQRWQGTGNELKSENGSDGCDESFAVFVAVERRGRKGGGGWRLKGTIFITSCEMIGLL